MQQTPFLAFALHPTASRIPPPPNRWTVYVNGFTRPWVNRIGNRSARADASRCKGQRGLMNSTLADIGSAPTCTVAEESSQSDFALPRATSLLGFSTRVSHLRAKKPQSKNCIQKVKFSGIGSEEFAGLDLICATRKHFIFPETLALNISSHPSN